MPGFTNCKETPVNRSFPVRCLAALVALVGIRSAPAAPVTWTIDQPNSSWTWSGSLKDGSSTLASLSSQGTGSLTTTHTGTIVTTTTYVGGAPTQIQVTGGSIAAANSGNWQPLAGGGSGSAPANYGGRFDLGFAGSVNMALRGMTFDASSAVQALGGSPGNYNFANGVTLTTTVPSSLDFRTSGFLIGTNSGTAPLSGAVLPNTGAANATLVKSAGPGLNATLNIPVSLPGITIPLDSSISAIFNFTGNVRATSVPSYLQTFNGTSVLADGTAQNVNLGSAIVGASLSNSAYSVRNTSPHTAADPSSIQLSATGSATVSPTSAATELAPGGNLALSLGINTATAGAKNGVVTVSNLDPLSTDANDTFNVVATVLDHSQASFANGFAQTSKTVNLGVLPQGGSLTVNNAYFVHNLTAPSGFTAPQDLTSVSPSGNTAKINSNVAPYTNQDHGAPNNHNFNVTVDRSTSGSFSSSYTMNFADSAMPGATAQGTPLTLNLQAQVIQPVAVSSVDAKTITRFNADGSGASVVATAANGLFSPLDVQFDNKGNLYVADNLTSKVVKVDANNAVTTFASFATGAINPAGFDFNSSTGKLTLANYLNSQVVQYTPPSSTPTNFAGSAQGVQGPFDVATDSLGNTYVVNVDNQRVMKIDSGGNSSVFADAADGLFTPISLAVDASNNVYVADVLTSSIRKFTPAGVGSIFAGFAQGVVSPTGLAFDDGGNLMVANYLGNNVLKITPAGASSVFTTASLPWGVSVFRTPTFNVPLGGFGAPVPEPSSWLLMVIGAAAMAFWGRRRQGK